jgi:hypothetical protein
MPRSSAPILSLALIALAALPVSAETKTFKAIEASAVEVGGGIKVVFTQGPAALSADSPEGDFSDLQMTSADGVLKIRRKSMDQRRWWGGGNSVNMRERDGVLTVKVNGKTMPSYTVRVALPEVRRLKAYQSSAISAAALSAGALTLDASSSGSIVAAGTSGVTVIDASSSGEVDASGLMASGLTVNASSSGEAKAKSHTAAPVSITTSSSADATVIVTQPAAVSADASTSSMLKISGACTDAIFSSSTSAELDASALSCNSINADASTSGSIEAIAKKTLIAKASTSGDIDVRGAPATRDIKESTSGSVSLAP